MHLYWSLMVRLPGALDRPRRIDFAIALGIIVSVLAIYSQVDKFGFVTYDDDQSVYENVHVRDGVTPDSIEWAMPVGALADERQDLIPQAEGRLPLETAFRPAPSGRRGGPSSYMPNPPAIPVAFAARSLLYPLHNCRGSVEGTSKALSISNRAPTVMEGIAQQSPISPRQATAILLAGVFASGRMLTHGGSASARSSDRKEADRRG